MCKSEAKVNQVVGIMDTNKGCRVGILSPVNRARKSPSPKTVKFAARTVNKSPDSTQRKSPSLGVPVAYSGVKFTGPPEPKVLPKPPAHWFLNSPAAPTQFNDMANQLKTLLKVQA